MTAVTTRASRGPTLETMTRMVTHVAPWLAAAAIGGALIFGPVASADPSANPGPYAAPSTAPGPSPYGSGEDPDVPIGSDLNFHMPDDPNVGIDLPS
jgi:hypothetical protein